MEIKLLHHTPLWVGAKAIRKCWASEDKSDTCEEVDIAGGCDGQDIYTGRIITGQADKELIHRVGNKNKHSSTLEHLNYTFDIEGISRACLQELARHRMASYSVKSTRYTLKELRNEEPFDDFLFDKERAGKYIVMTGDADVDMASMYAMDYLRTRLEMGIPNDITKYCLPEAYKTSLVMTINARSLQNFLELRSNPSALWEIRNLAQALFDSLPNEHQYLFEEYMYDNTRGSDTGAEEA